MSPDFALGQQMGTKGFIRGHSGVRSLMGHQLLIWLSILCVQQQSTTPTITDGMSPAANWAPKPQLGLLNLSLGS